MMKRVIFVMVIAITALLAEASKDFSFYDRLYSGDVTSERAATYLYLCSRSGDIINAPESCCEKCCRDNCGPDGCCDACATGKHGLFIGIVTADERDGLFSKLDASTVGLIWSGALSFFSTATSCYAKSANIAFDSAYNSERYASVIDTGRTDVRYSKPYFFLEKVILFMKVMNFGNLLII